MLDTISTLCKGWPVIVSQEPATDHVMIAHEGRAFIITREVYLDNFYKKHLDILLPRLCDQGPW